MKKLFKNGKMIMAYVMAFAVLAVSLFTGAVVTADAQAIGTCGRTVVEQWDGKDENGNWIGWIYGTFSGGTGTKDDPYIIKYSEQLAHLTASSSTTYENSVGVYYKVDDSIKAFDMNTTGQDLSGNMTAADVKSMLADEVVGRTYWTTSVFAGNFDGNGVEIYGLHSGDVNYGTGEATYQYAGLFPVVSAGAVIKNVTLKNSYFYTGYNKDTAALIGYVNDAAAGTSADTVYVENCVVKDCYIEGANSAVKPGIIAGTVGSNAYIKISNCLVYGNTVINNNNSKVCVVGSASKNANSTTQNRIIDSIILDANPYDANGSWWFKACDHGIYQNVYFDNSVDTSGFANYGNAKSKLTQLASDDAAKGVAATQNITGFDNSVWFFNNSDYPQLRVFHDIQTVDNNDGTHSEKCDCGLASSPVAHNYADGVCVCGAVAKCGEVVSVFSGTLDTTLSGSGTQDNPYLITSADEFAAVVKGQIAGATDQTYFKVAGIDAIYMNGGATVAGLSNVDEVKSYFTTTSGLNNWSGGTFTGQFDGNGVTVYGLYSTAARPSLFGTVKGHSSIKNIALKNSYLNGDHNQSFGALVACTQWHGDSAATDSVDFENIIIANNYVNNKNDVKLGAGILLGYAYDKDLVTVNNCLVYGNDFDSGYTGGTPVSGLVTCSSGAQTDVSIKNVVSIGIEPWPLSKKNDNTYETTNYLLAQANQGKMQNVYTDQSVEFLQGYYEWNNNAENLAKNNINVISAEEIKGNSNLKFDSYDWLFTADGYPEFRTFHDAELEIAIADDEYAGHVESCSCGLETPVVKHTYKVDDETLGWDAEWKCIDCGFVCDHQDMDRVTMEEWEADCINDGGYSGSCECGFAISETYGDCTGHSFVSHDAVEGEDCKSYGTIAYKSCARCGKNYSADADAKEPYENEITDLTDGLGTCKPITDASGIVYGSDDSNHWTICSVCNEVIETVAHTGVTVANGKDGHSVVCEICKYASDNAPHVFGDDNVCDTCDWECTEHKYVDGEIKNEGDCTNNRVVAQICEICGTAGEDKVSTAPGHTDGEVQTENVVSPDCDTPGSHDEVVYCTVCTQEVSRVTKPDSALGHTTGSTWEENHVYDCINGHSYEEVTNCSVCFAEISRVTKNEEATGHDIYAYDEAPATCSWEGWYAHSQCTQCGKYFEYGTTDKFSEEYIDEAEILIDIVADAHNFIEVEAVDADCENGGTIAYKYCEYCDLFIVGEQEIELVIDYDALHESIDAELSDAYDKAYEEFLTENPEPDEDASEEAWNEFYEAFDEIWMPIYDSIYYDAYEKAVIEAAEAEGVVFETEATGHVIVKVDEVAATYEKDGVKAHYACECGKLYSDAEGKNEVTADELIIAKLVKEDDTTATPEVKPEGDTSDKSPATDDSLASVVVFATLIGAAFVATKKFIVK